MKKIILIVFCLLLCGCYDYTELNEISIINGIGVDYVNDEYVVSLEVVKNDKDVKSNEMSTEIITGKDKVLAKAFNKAELSSEKQTMMEQVSLLLIGQNLAKKGIEEISDYVIRDTSISNNINMIVCKDPVSILNMKMDNDSVSNVIINTINNISHMDDTQSTDLVAMNLVSKRKDIALPYVEDEEEEIKIEEIAYFKESAMVDTMDAKMYEFLELNSKHIDFNDEENSFEIYKKKIAYDVSENVIKIKVKCYGRVEEIGTEFNLANPNDYKKIHSHIEEVINKEIEEFLKKTRSEEVDLLGLRNLYYKKYKKDISLDQLDVVIESKFTMDKNGAMLEVLYD